MIPLKYSKFAACAGKLTEEKKSMVRVATFTCLLFDSEEDTGRGSVPRAAMPTGEDKGFGDAALLTNPLLPKHIDTKIKMRICTFLAPLAPIKPNN